MPFRKEVVCVCRESGPLAAAGTSHPRQRGYGAVPEPRFRGWLGSQEAVQRGTSCPASALSGGLAALP